MSNLVPVQSGAGCRLEASPALLRVRIRHSHWLCRSSEGPSVRQHRPPHSVCLYDTLSTCIYTCVNNPCWQDGGGTHQVLSLLCVCCAAVCLYTHVYFRLRTRTHTHTHRVRDRAIKRLFTEIPHTPLVHWFNFKAMRTIAEKIKVL